MQGLITKIKDNLTPILCFCLVHLLVLLVGYVLYGYSFISTILSCSVMGSKDLPTVLINDQLGLFMIYSYVFISLMIQMLKRHFPEYMTLLRFLIMLFFSWGFYKWYVLYKFSVSLNSIVSFLSLMLFGALFCWNLYKSYIASNASGNNIYPLHHPNLLQEFGLFIKTLSDVQNEVQNIVADARPKILNLLYKYGFMDFWPSCLLTVMLLHIVFFGYIFNGLVMLWALSLCLWIDYFRYSDKLFAENVTLHDELFSSNLEFNYKQAGFEYFKSSSLLLMDSPVSSGGSSNSDFNSNGNSFARKVFNQFSYQGGRAFRHVNTHAGAYGVILGCITTITMIVVGWQTHSMSKAEHNSRMDTSTKVNEMTCMALESARAGKPMDPGLATIVSGSAGSSQANSPNITNNVSFEPNINPSGSAKK